jgi:general secretion pathway protein J
MRKIQHHKGFTLIEILVALAIFAVIGVVAASCLHQMMGYRTRLIARSDQWRTLAIARLLIQKDFSNAIDLDQLDVGALWLPVFNGQPTHLSLTRINHSSSMVSKDADCFVGVMYGFADHHLMRTRILSNGQRSTSTIVDGVDSAQFYYLNASKQWEQQWSLQNASDPSAKVLSASKLPEAMRLILRLQGMGTVQWDFTKPVVSG